MMKPFALSFAVLGIGLAASALSQDPAVPGHQLGNGIDGAMQNSTVDGWGLDFETPVFFHELSCRLESLGQEVKFVHGYPKNNRVDYWIEVKAPSGTVIRSKMISFSHTDIREYDEENIGPVYSQMFVNGGLLEQLAKKTPISYMCRETARPLSVKEWASRQEGPEVIAFSGYNPQGYGGINFSFMSAYSENGVAAAKISTPLKSLHDFFSNPGTAHTKEFVFSSRDSRNRVTLFPKTIDDVFDQLRNADPATLSVYLYPYVKPQRWYRVLSGYCDLNIGQGLRSDLLLQASTDTRTIQVRWGEPRYGECTDEIGYPLSSSWHNKHSTLVLHESTRAGIESIRRLLLESGANDLHQNLLASLGRSNIYEFSAYSTIAPLAVSLLEIQKSALAQVSAWKNGLFKDIVKAELNSLPAFVDAKAAVERHSGLDHYLKFNSYQSTVAPRTPIGAEERRIVGIRGVVSNARDVLVQKWPTVITKGSKNGCAVIPALAGALAEFKVDYYEPTLSITTNPSYASSGYVQEVFETLRVINTINYNGEDPETFLQTTLPDWQNICAEVVPQVEAELAKFRN